MSRYLIRPIDGVHLSMGGMAVRLTVPSDRTSGVFAVTEHGLDERRLIPPHRHQHEDECSFVLEGTLGARVGDDELEAAPGSCILAPRGRLVENREHGSGRSDPGPQHQHDDRRHPDVPMDLSDADGEIGDDALHQSGSCRT